MSREWNPRFVFYARAHDRTPDEQLEHDDTAFPGGRMTGFVLWMNARWREWRETRGLDRYYPLGADDYAAFDWFLEREVGAS